ncbi:MAG: trypsin-like serine protease [Pacificimonas sp.]
MKFASILLAAAATIATSAHAAGNTQSGTFGGSSWTATNNIIGRTSTATPAGGGDPIYFAQDPKYRGTVGMLMDYGPEIGRFVCSGSLLNDRRSVLTAAHCVSNGAGTPNPISTTIFFFDGDPSTNVYAGGPNVRTLPVTKYAVNPAYTGEVIDQNDIAVLTLPFIVPESYGNSYDFDRASDLTGVDFNIAGYGARSDVGGDVGRNLGTGRLRQGDNRYDFRLGDDDFDGFFTDADATGEKFFGTADVEFSYLYDLDNGVETLDNGVEVNDASCRLAVLGLGIERSDKYCDLGRGPTEAASSGGDSGGPQFVDGVIASVTSYGLSFGEFFGDIDGALNSSFGEFSGVVPTAIHTDFIEAQLQVPAPAALGLFGLGFGVLALRRRRKAA